MYENGRDDMPRLFKSQQICLHEIENKRVVSKNEQLSEIVVQNEILGDSYGKGIGALLQHVRTR
jgi:hypothetical protein